jgi:outer membrane protein
MFKAALALIAVSFIARGEVRTMTLRQAVETAIQQNPDIALSRLDEEKARQAIRLARDPFYPRLVAGSGLAKNWGFPMSIEGSAPSVVQAKVIADVFNRPQNYAIAQAKENARASALAVGSKRDEVAYRVASLYLDAERSARVLVLAQKDLESQQKVLETVQAQVREGRALPLAEKAAALAVARARQVAATLEDDQLAAETALAIGLGLSASDRVRPLQEERAAPPLPSSPEQAIEGAIESNKELRRLESQMISKQLEVRGARAARLPRVDLVAQYGMLARFNNYDEFFRAFQRNNGQLGVSFQIPLFAGPAVSAQAAQAQADVSRLKIELNNTRNRLASDLQQSFRDLRKAEGAAEVARLDLDVAREQLSVNLAQMQEGRLTLRQVEETRVVENQKWMAFYDAEYAMEKARWNVLRLTGRLVPAISELPQDHPDVRN